MAWQTLNADDMTSALTQPERDLFESGAASSGTDRLDQILIWVVALVRGKVAACAKNREYMGPDGTVPAELYGDAIEIARYKLLTSFPQGKLFIDDARVRGYSDAVKHLDDAAAGTLAVEVATGKTFALNLSGFGSRDDYLDNPAKPWNSNVVDFGFWQ
jgi:hypothetical protein